ncbi:MAG TPA: hypothetical protein VGL59_09380 [Polyangia bacterium]
MPPAIEARLKELTDQLGKIICERSRNCCSGYGFQPLSDCSVQADAPFDLYAGELLAGGSENFDYAVDEALAAACLDVARSVVNDCTFATEPLDAAWTLPCAHALRVTPKGQTPAECFDDNDCETIRGADYRCFNHACLPAAPMPTGASCLVPPNPTSVPVCSGTDYCGDEVCTRIGGPGDNCIPVQDACVAGYVCDCDPTVGCSKLICFHEPTIGDVCAKDDDCGIRLKCSGGHCAPRQLGICQ